MILTVDMPAWLAALLILCAAAVVCSLVRSREVSIEIEESNHE